ncbi:hypothetical protein BGW36DRAFT_285461 [Talaromyces proteolyticus]|uniref:Uncharacterized protein n=1 Tax=Talaromyces proteolyticus TaxID=1131652 RepID=A0AAD4Q1F6_9EURO|nr:uncharacterized protein BGW36DRAFT_285461 [Talaromyces proteolyticus]KAH8705595.1 hypothetical protein BGW36DRAFT_285461 [Talaromyces proteolyticus]
MAPSAKATRTFLLTASIVSITIGGSLYGAELKSKQEKKQIIEKDHQATFDEKIQSLQSARQVLVSKKLAVEKQLQDLEIRIAERSRKGLASSTSKKTDQDGQSK